MVRDSGDEKKMESSVNWPEVQGEVISSKMVWGHVEVRYEYWLFAERYEAAYKISLHPVVPGGKGWSSLRSAAKLGAEGSEYMAQYPVAEKVVVRYNHSKPGESVLYCKGEVGPGSSDGPKVEAHFVTLE